MLILRIINKCNRANQEHLKKLTEKKLTESLTSVSVLTMPAWRFRTWRSQLALVVKASRQNLQAYGRMPVCVRWCLTNITKISKALASWGSTKTRKWKRSEITYFFDMSSGIFKLRKCQLLRWSLAFFNLPKLNVLRTRRKATTEPKSCIFKEIYTKFYSLSLAVNAQLLSQNVNSWNRSSQSLWGYEIHHSRG